MESDKYYWEDCPTCPWCGKKQEDHGYGNFCDMAQDEYRVFECQRCDKKFSSAANWTVNFSNVAIGCLFHKLEAKNKYNCGAVDYVCNECDTKFYSWELHDGEHPKIKKEEYEIVENDPYILEAK